MELLSKFYKGFRFSLCVTNSESKYAWIVPLQDKTSIIIAKAFQEILDESWRKLNNIWVDKGSEFYNRSLKSWSQDNDEEMHSTHNKGKSIVDERFIGTLKKKVSDFSKCVYL